jgi:hypothetical protein
MKTNRVSTTVSSKHWALLQKNAEKYGSQQKVLEHALESLEYNNSKPIIKISPEEEIWMRIGKELNLVCLVQKECLKVLLENVNMEHFEAHVKDQKPLEYVLEFFYQKPLKDCNLKEIMDGIIINARTGHWFETISYTDNGAYYLLNGTHDMGFYCSKINSLFVEGLLKTYGAKFESTISERTMFVKIYK